jgi:hypothetical protein
MICNDIPLHDRVELAVQEILILQPDELPPDFREAFNRIEEMNNSFRYINMSSNFEAELAQAIYQLFKNLISATGYVSQ